MYANLRPAQMGREEEFSLTYRIQCNLVLGYQRVSSCFLLLFLLRLVDCVLVGRWQSCLHWACLLQSAKQKRGKYIYTKIPY